ncbi:MAG: ECF transporter S component [Clostridia bacterium]
MKDLKSNTRKLTFMGVMLALTIAFVVMTAVPTTAASMALVMFIPTFATAIIYGPKAGMLMGFFAGIATMLRAILAPMSPFDYLFINPLVSVLPRTFIGFFAYYGYYFVKKIFKNEKISIALGGAIGAASNTALVMTMLYIVYASEIIEMAGVSFKVFLITVITTSAVIEAIAGAILTLPIVIAFNKLNK